MQYSVQINDVEVEAMLAAFNEFSTNGISEPMRLATRNIYAYLRENIEKGMDVEGNKYPEVTMTTEELQIAFSGPFTNRRRRMQVSDNPIAMNVTHETLDSISSERVSATEYVVGYDGDRSDIVLKSNAGKPGNVKKPKRDPLGLGVGIPTDKEFNFVADEVERALDRMLNGL